MFLRKVRRMIKDDYMEEDYYSIENAFMTVGTLLVVLGICSLGVIGVGTRSSINSDKSRYFSQNSMLNILLGGAASSILCFMLKRHVVRGDQKRTQRYDIKSLCNGFISGSMAVSVGSGVFQPWASLFAGFI